MTRILHINASPRGAASQSRAVARAFVEDLARRHAGAEIDTLDLFAEGLPEFGIDAAEAKLAVFTGATQTQAQSAAWDRAREVFDRFARADVYVLNLPIWNHGIPYLLKQYIDLVTQPGWSFSFAPEAGYTGLLTGKRAVRVVTAGVHAPGVPAEFGADFATPYLDAWLRFVGVEDISELRFAPTVLTADPASAFERAEQDACELAAHF